MYMDSCPRNTLFKVLKSNHNSSLYLSIAASVQMFPNVSHKGLANVVKYAYEESTPAWICPWAQVIKEIWDKQGGSYLPTWRIFASCLSRNYSIGNNICPHTNVHQARTIGLSLSKTSGKHLKINCKNTDSSSNVHIGPEICEEWPFSLHRNVEYFLAEEWYFYRRNTFATYHQTDGSKKQDAVHGIQAIGPYRKAQQDRNNQCQKIQGEFKSVNGKKKTLISQMVICNVWILK